MGVLEIALVAVAVQMPPVLPIDLTAIVAVVMGTLMFLIPIAGLTARFALKPIAEAVARVRESQSAASELALMEQRLALLEQQMGSVETEVRHIQETLEFDRQLRSGEGSSG